MKIKKVGTLLLVAMCFFVGITLISEFPTVGALVVLFEAIACYLCGLWANKSDAEFVDDLVTENENLTEELAKATTEIEELTKTNAEIEDLKKTIKTLKAEKETVVAPKTPKKKVSKQ
jgi:hypothetical protein